MSISDEVRDELVKAFARVVQLEQDAGGWEQSAKRWRECAESLAWAIRNPEQAARIEEVGEACRAARAAFVEDVVREATGVMRLHGGFDEGGRDEHSR